MRLIRTLGSLKKKKKRERDFEKSYIQTFAHLVLLHTCRKGKQEKRKPLKGIGLDSCCTS